jgi:phage terminase small subunit
VTRAGVRAKIREIGKIFESKIKKVMRAKKQPEPDLFPDPPPHLSESSKALWLELGPKAAGNDAGRRAMLQAGLEALDRAEQARQLVAIEGVIKPGTGKIAHRHPAVQIELDARKQFSKIWKELGIGAAGAATRVTSYGW